MPFRRTDDTDETGKLRYCIGSNRTRSGIKWFRYRDIDPNTISFCEGCSKNFSPSDITEITEEDYPGLKCRLVCDTSDTNHCLRHDIDVRCLNYRGVRCNVNAINEANTDFRPVTRIPTDNSKLAAEHGALLARLPTHTYWEMVARLDPSKKFPSNYHLKLITSKFGDGRVATLTNSRGNSNIYYPTNSLIVMNSYQTGVTGQRWFYISSSEMEKSSGEAPKHEGDSNKLFLKFGIYEKVYRCPSYGCSKTFIKQTQAGRCCVDDSETMVRSSKPKAKGGRVCRGGGQFRGGGSVSKGRSSYTGGSNLAASGFSSHVSTITEKDAIYQPIDETIEITIQLVSNDSEEMKIAKAQSSYYDVEVEKESRIAQLEAELSTLRSQPKSCVSGHLDQLMYLVP